MRDALPSANNSVVEVHKSIIVICNDNPYDMIVVKVLNSIAKTLDTRIKFVT